jgi:hypothetical protein
MRSASAAHTTMSEAPPPPGPRTTHDHWSDHTIQYDTQRRRSADADATTTPPAPAPGAQRPLPPHPHPHRDDKVIGAPPNIKNPKNIRCTYVHTRRPTPAHGTGIHRAQQRTAHTSAPPAHHGHSKTKRAAEPTRSCKRQAARRTLQLLLVHVELLLLPKPIIDEALRGVRVGSSAVAARPS